MNFEYVLFSREDVIKLMHRIEKARRAHVGLYFPVEEALIGVELSLKKLEAALIESIQKKERV